MLESAKESDKQISDIEPLEIQKTVIFSISVMVFLLTVGVILLVCYNQNKKIEHKKSDDDVEKSCNFKSKEILVT